MATLKILYVSDGIDQNSIKDLHLTELNASYNEKKMLITNGINFKDL